MDTNVVGRKRAFRFPPPGYVPPEDEDMPQIRHIFVRGLSAKTHGNAAGIGTADFTTTRLIKEMNYRDTIINCLTAGYPEGANLPVYFDTDREVLDAALAIMGTRTAAEARILRIRNTLCLEDLEMSEPCLGERGADAAKPTGPARAVSFDAQGNLEPLAG
jgi:hypothetical protein